MSWELRLWLPALPESLQQVFSKVERRTDLYALGLGDDVGVKRRNGTDLEIKRREKRKKRGAEKWRKTKVETVDNDTWMSCEKQRAKCTLPPPHDNIKVEVADVRFENGISSKSIAFEKGKPHELYAACGSVLGLGDEWTADDLRAWGRRASWAATRRLFAVCVVSGRADGHTGRCCAFVVGASSSSSRVPGALALRSSHSARNARVAREFGGLVRAAA